MQLRHLRTFVAIVDTGTLTAAAEQLYKTQGAVSQDLKKLESGLGVTLVDRSGQRIRLTAAGHALLPMARRLLSDLADAEAEMDRIRAGERPVVRIGCLPSVAPTVLELLSGFAAEQPRIRWAVATGLRGGIIAGLRSGRHDLAICEAHPDDELTYTPLSREPLHVVLPRSHPLATTVRLRPQDLAEVPYIGLDRSMGAAGEAERFFTAGETYPTPVVEVTEARLVLDLVVRLGGYGIVPDSVLTAHAPVAAVDTDPPLVRQVSLVHLADRPLPPIAAAFANHLSTRWPRH